MNIERTNTDELNAVISIKIGKEDYKENVNKVIKDYRKKANVPGFRPGKVPEGIIRKMYGAAVIAEEVNKILVDRLSKYITNEKLHILGEPLPSEKEQPELNFEIEKEYQFDYNIALAPQLDIDLSKQNKFPHFQLIVEDKHIDEHIANTANRFGAPATVDAAEGKDIIKGVITELDAHGNPKEGGVEKTDGMLALDVIKDEDTKKLFDGCKADSLIDFNPMTAFGNDTEVSSLLAVEKTSEALNANYRMTVSEITRFTSHEVNQELFDKAYGEGAIENEEAFREKIKEELQNAFKNEANYKFKIDAKEKLVADTEFDLPEAFLKRWILLSSKRRNEDKEITAEQIEAEWPLFNKDLRWQLIRDHIAKAGELKVEHEEIKAYATRAVRAQFAQYGMANLPDEQILGYVDNMLQKEEEYNKYAEAKLEDKVTDYIQDKVKLETTEISTEDFNKLFETK